MSDMRKRPDDQDLWLRYLGALAVLGDAAAHVSDRHLDGQECRERIEAVMCDAEDHYPIKVRGTLLRFDIEPETI